MIFYQTKEAQQFIESSDSRETDTRVMQAIVYASKTLNDAENIWDNGLSGLSVEELVKFIDTATSKNSEEPSEIYWGHSTLAEAVLEAYPSWQFEHAS